MRGIILFFLVVHCCHAAASPAYYLGELPQAFEDCPEIVAAAREIDAAQVKYMKEIRKEVESWDFRKLPQIVLDEDPRQSEREKSAMVANYNRIIDVFKANDYFRNNGGGLLHHARELAEVRSRLKAAGLLPTAPPTPQNEEASAPKKKPKIKAKLADGTVIEE